MSIKRQIKKNKRNNTLSAYAKKAFDNGYKKGMMDAISHLQNNITVLKEVEGIDEKLFTSIVNKLEETRLV